MNTHAIHTLPQLHRITANLYRRAWSLGDDGNGALYLRIYYSAADAERFTDRCDIVGGNDVIREVLRDAVQDNGALQ